ncbi:MAG: DUF5682 family protein [Ilumatobacteraceae bacterium]
MGRPHLLGIRHHGPGSARSLVAALDELRPDTVAVELPADTQGVLRWAGADDLVPPVAILGHVVGDPRRAAFLPFAEFSPEWQALRWAQRNERPVVAIDLPLTTMLASGSAELDLDGEAPIDPIGLLAAAAGDPDPERWWDDVVEHHGSGLGSFGAVAEAMATVRAGRLASAAEARREAHMRKALRPLLAAGEVVAVVCGAWHVPALQQPWPPVAADNALLRGLPKVKVGLSWVPWSHRRLAAASGYGAGVRSPGWYAHVFAHPGDHGRARWFVQAARLLRARGMQASPDHLIAATRAAVSLAALRARPAPGLAEVLDAADTVMAGASGLRLIVDELVIGDAIGAVPHDAPQVPLAADINRLIRTLRLKPQVGRQRLELDLRTPGGHGRSVMLHRLGALGVAWGQVVDGRGSSGSFRETWELAWDPEFSLQVVEASAYGTTLQAAAAARLAEVVAAAGSPADLIVALERALLADLADVVGPCVRRLADAAAEDPDVTQVMDALGPLARTLRYGDARGTHAGALQAAFDGLVVRVIAGAVQACRSLDDAAARAMVERLAAVHAALALCEHAERRAGWPALLASLVDRADVHGLVRGRSTRLLHDGEAWPADRVRAAFSRALSVGTAPAHGAAFVEGFLAGSGTVLLHDRALLGVVDDWLCGLPADGFQATVALLRRTFGAFAAAERRQLGEVLRAGEVTVVDPFGADLDHARAQAAMVTVRLMIGAPVEVAP